MNERKVWIKGFFFSTALYKKIHPSGERRMDFYHQIQVSIIYWAAAYSEGKVLPPERPSGISPARRPLKC